MEPSLLFEGKLLLLCLLYNIDEAGCVKIESFRLGKTLQIIEPVNLTLPSYH